MDNARKPPMRRRDTGTPWPLAAIHMAERFGRWPWELEDQPTDKVLWYTRIMGIEAEAREAMDGLKPDEPFYRED